MRKKFFFFFIFFKTFYDALMKFYWISAYDEVFYFVKFYHISLSENITDANKQLGMQTVFTAHLIFAFIFDRKGQSWDSTLDEKWCVSLGSFRVNHRVRYQNIFRNGSWLCRSRMISCKLWLKTEWPEQFIMMLTT